MFSSGAMSDVQPPPPAPCIAGAAPVARPEPAAARRGPRKQSRAASAGGNEARMERLR